MVDAISFGVSAVMLLLIRSHGIAYPLGALIAAGLAGVIGVRGGIAIGWAGMAFSLLLLVLSPLPRIKLAADYDTPPEAPTRT